MKEYTENGLKVHASADLSLFRPMIESEVNEIDEEEETYIQNVKRKSKIRFSGEQLRQYKDQDQINCPLGVLTSFSNYLTAEMTEEKDGSSSEDEVEEENNKKKKLSAAEKENKRNKTKNVEAIVDSMLDIESSGYYEQLLMNNLNSSTLWLKYITFCLATIGFETARSIGRRALKSINMTCEDDRFNIWMTLLSIENLYGSKESFDNVFDEAIKFNDAFKVYMRATDLLFESGKHVELEGKICEMKAKFKKEPEVWFHIAKLYYLMGNFQEARNIRNMCLKSVSIKKEQYNLILKFAILEFTHGETDTGILIFEKVLITYPNKIGTWLIYIDQLMSKNQIREARNVLNRAITLSLPLKSTKAIYHKYRTFEEKYGTLETLASFKERAKRILQKKIHLIS